VGRATAATVAEADGRLRHCRGAAQRVSECPPERGGRSVCLGARRMRAQGLDREMRFGLALELAQDDLRDDCNAEVLLLHPEEAAHDITPKRRMTSASGVLTVLRRACLPTSAHAPADAKQHLERLVVLLLLHEQLGEQPQRTKHVPVPLACSSRPNVSPSCATKADASVGSVSVRWRAGSHGVWTGTAGTPVLYGYYGSSGHSGYSGY
jgi:hypothetical protein